MEDAVSEAEKEMAAKAPILKDKPTIKYEVYDEHDQPIEIKKPWWKRIFK